jgi:RecA/RadA recombinase
LVTIVARSNSGKTTFAMDIIQANAKRGKKCFYINLEFAIKTMWENRWLFINGKKKRNLTDLDPLSDEDRSKMDKYVDDKLKQFEYHNEPKGMELDKLVDLLIEKNNE